MMEHISPIVANNLPKSVFNILITYNKRYIIFDILGKRLQHSSDWEVWEQPLVQIKLRPSTKACTCGANACHKGKKYFNISSTGRGILNLHSHVFLLNINTFKEVPIEEVLARINSFLSCLKFFFITIITDTIHSFDGCHPSQIV